VKVCVLARERERVCVCVCVAAHKSPWVEVLWSKSRLRGLPDTTNKQKKEEKHREIHTTHTSSGTNKQKKKDPTQNLAHIMLGFGCEYGYGTAVFAAAATTAAS
jgi:hypothetical protein